MEDDDDAVYDEIDRFHLKKDKSTLDLVIHKRKRRIKEVLSVRVDDDEDLGFGQEETGKILFFNIFEPPFFVNKLQQWRGGGGIENLKFEIRKNWNLEETKKFRI